MAGMENPFDQLSDDLVINILDRLLWSPFEFGAKRAKERVRLEAVCKRFQRAVSASQTLEWDRAFDRESEDHFTRYISSRHQSLIKLSRFALLLQGDACVISYLLLVVPRALQTLTEVRLYLSGYYDTDENVVDWYSVLELLQACPKLAVLEIHLAECDVDCPSYTLNSSRLLNTFPSIVSLTLYGFCVSSGRLSEILQRFPSLQNLEMHLENSPTKEDIKAGHLNKLFLWGGANDGRFDRANPAKINLPKSLEMLLKLLISGDRDEQQSIIPRLEYIVLSGGAPLKLLAKMPEALAVLLNMLEDADALYRGTVALILANLGREPEGQAVIGGVPDTMQRLIRCIEVGNIEHNDGAFVLEHIAWVFYGLAGDTKLRKVVGEQPGIFKSLAALLVVIEAPESLLETAGAALGRLALDSKNADAMTAEPGCLLALVRALSLESDRLVAHTVKAMSSMANSPLFRIAIAEVPGAMEGLAGVVARECDDTVRDAAAVTLHKLAMRRYERGQMRSRMGR